MGRESGLAVFQMQPGEAEDRRLPGLAEAGEVQPLLAGVAHHVAQVEPERLIKISLRRLVQSVLCGEERVRGEAQRRVVQAERLEVLLRGELFGRAEPRRQPRHKQQHVRLLYDAQTLERVEADAGIGRRVVRL